MDISASAVYFELLDVMEAHLKSRYPSKRVVIELDDDGTPTGLLVYGIGEHGLVRFPLGYENYSLGL